MVKYGIDRSDVVQGRILGEGFFGEVYDGVYKKAVSLCPRRRPREITPKNDVEWESRMSKTKCLYHRHCLLF